MSNKLIKLGTNNLHIIELIIRLHRISLTKTRKPTVYCSHHNNNHPK